MCPDAATGLHCDAASGRVVLSLHCVGAHPVGCRSLGNSLRSWLLVSPGSRSPCPADAGFRSFRSDRHRPVGLLWGKRKPPPGVWCLAGVFLPLGPVGPWCLLLGDTHQAVSTFAIRAIPQMLGGVPARTEACDEAFDLGRHDGPRIGPHRGRSRQSDELLRRPEGLLDCL
jgi:hypothetical protein